MGANEAEATRDAGIRKPSQGAEGRLSPKDGRVAAAIEIGRTVFGRQRKRPLRDVR